jgi:SRSO17 transposase
LRQGKADAAFRTKPRIALQLIEAALNIGVLFRAIVADSGYGTNSTFVGHMR